MARAIRRRTRLTLPPGVASELSLDRGERPLAWAVDVDGHWHVGTDRALHTSEGDRWRTLRWEHIERAEWQGDPEVLRVVEVVGWGEPEVQTDLALADAGRLLDLLRERVTKSVVVTVFAVVHRRRGLSVVGRRSPLGEGDVLWSYVLSQGLDPDDPSVIKVAERTLEQARAELAGL